MLPSNDIINRFLLSFFSNMQYSPPPFSSQRIDKYQHQKACPFSHYLLCFIPSFLNIFPYSLLILILNLSKTKKKDILSFFLNNLPLSIHNHRPHASLFSTTPLKVITFFHLHLYIFPPISYNVAYRNENG